jgi:hypothetical protein
MSRSEQEADEGEKVLMVREKEKGGRGKAGGDGGRHAFKRVRRGWGGGMAGGGGRRSGGGGRERPDRGGGTLTRGPGHCALV